MHTNSLLAYKQLDKSKRCHIIYSIFDVFGQLTDRQVAEKLGFGDLNCVRPRITEMIQGGYLKECGATKDHITNRTVRIVRIRRENLQEELW